MSVDRVEIFAQTKENACREFSFVDEDATPVNVLKPVPLQPLRSTSAIVVTGYIPPNALRFSVNLVCKTPGYIALHFNVRLDRGYVVRNSKFKGCWEDEETCSPSGSSSCVFRRNSYVHILIFCTENEYQIAVNGEHFCAFSYRMPLEDVTSIEINGSIEDVRYRQYNLFVYPDPKTDRPSTTLTLKTDQPLLELDVPITVDVDGFKVGTHLIIAGRLKLLPHSFYVNLQKGKAIYPHPIIALHLNPRFLYGSSAPYVVMNCWNNGSWGHEERHQGHLSWMPGRNFLLTIKCEHESYTIWIGDKMIGEFNHRLQPSIIDTLKITGDIVLHELALRSNDK